MKRHLLLLLGEGGHSKEMFRLASLLSSGTNGTGTNGTGTNGTGINGTGAAGDNGTSFRYSYVMIRDDEVSASKVSIPGPIYRVIRPRDKAHNAVIDTLKTLICAVQACAILLRARPDALITTGPGVAVPVCAVAKLLRVKVIFVETGSRIHALSTTGKIVYRFADLFLVQWQELLPACPKAIYAGRLW